MLACARVLRTRTRFFRLRDRRRVHAHRENEPPIAPSSITFKRRTAFQSSSLTSMMLRYKAAARLESAQWRSRARETDQRAAILRDEHRKFERRSRNRSAGSSFSSAFPRKHISFPTRRSTRDFFVVCACYRSTQLPGPYMGQDSQTAAFNSIVSIKRRIVNSTIIQKSKNI